MHHPVSPGWADFSIMTVSDHCHSACTLWCNMRHVCRLMHGIGPWFKSRHLVPIGGPTLMPSTVYNSALPVKYGILQGYTPKRQIQAFKFTRDNTSFFICNPWLSPASRLYTIYLYLHNEQIILNHKTFNCMAHAISISTSTQCNISIETNESLTFCYFAP